LTPQKFKTLIQQVLDLNIDTEQRLKGCIDIIFEKVKILTVKFDKFAHYVLVKYGHEVYLLCAVLLHFMAPCGLRGSK